MGEVETTPAEGPAGRPRTVELRLSEGEFALLEGLAAYHHRAIEDLLSGGLPRIIEKYQVLRRLDERGPGPGPRQRRAFVTGLSQNRHGFAPLRSQPLKEENDR